MVNICPKADSPHDKQGVRASIDRVEGVTCRNSTVISNRRLQLVISGLTSIILVVLATAYLQFQGAVVPISLQSFSELWQPKPTYTESNGSCKSSRRNEDF